VCARRATRALTGSLKKKEERGLDEIAVAIHPELDAALGVPARADHVGKRRCANPELPIVR
jgi:hypothetical protein